MILVDTSVLIDLFKGENNKPVKALKEVIQNNIPYSITSLVFQEVLQGARDKKEFALLNRYLSCQKFLYPKDAITTYKKAALIYFNARKHGVTIRSTVDCIIAQIAIENKALLLHNDRDYTYIAKFTELKFYIA